MSDWQKAGPATAAQLTALLSATDSNLPAAYVSYLRESNGGEGELGVEPGWVSLWPAEAVLERNSGYELSKWLPGFLGFATNGGGELLAFDMRHSEPYPIVMVPLILMNPNAAVQVAASFEELRRSFGIALRTRDE